MLSLGAATRVYLAAGATDMRKGFEGLFALAKARMQMDPLSGHVFVFCNRPRNRIKVLYFDGSGLWVCAKRLERGRFRWPIAVEGPSMMLSRAELTLLLEGIDLKEARRRRGWYRAEEIVQDERKSEATS
jgi:transposase